MEILVRLVVTGLAIWLAALIVPGVSLVEGEPAEEILGLLLVAVVFTIVNAVLKPILKMLTFPLYLVTLGLFALVVNALLLWLTGWVSAELGLGLDVDGFWAAFLGAIVVSLATVGLRRVFGGRRRS
jgi:putative membrane protein